MHRIARASLLLALLVTSVAGSTHAQRTQKPPLHGRHWMAITGKPLAATAGAMMFQQGGNAVDAAAAMLAATSTMWDVLSWGGETQALIFNPNTGEVIGLNALGVAPSGATPEYYRERGMRYPPEYGPLAATKASVSRYPSAGRSDSAKPEPSAKICRRSNPRPVSIAARPWPIS